MCGIAGYIGIQKHGRQKIINTLDLMKNRGPDNQNWVEYIYKNKFILLLHSRLSIIDLDERSNQPFTIGNYTIIYNGEIYNYFQLREKLQKLGYKFSTKSDTEVLLKSYIEFGEDCVKYFNGMWAFAIWDKNKGSLFISRDRFGEKPIFYLKDNDGIYFASEVKAIQSLISKKLKIDYDYLKRYIIYGYKFLHMDNRTFFHQIFRMESATNMIISEDGIKTIKYWEPKAELNYSLSYKDALDGVKKHLFESIRLRLNSDVPLAFCLSGGIDSSSLASIAKKLFNYNVVTFSIIDKDKRYNELDNISETINDLNCEHFLIDLKYDDMFSKLENLVVYHDSPISTISYFIHSLISEKINANGFKVSVSGTSADEIFTGYYDHYNLHLYEMRNHKDFRIHLKNWEEFILPRIRNPFLKDPMYYFKNQTARFHNHLNSDIFLSFMYENFKTKIKERVYTKSLLRNRMINELLHEVTPVILHEDDLNSMSNSIENRSPYLDIDLVEFCHSIPSSYLIKNGYSKFILRDSVKNILNEKVRLDRRKKGFNASIRSLFDFSKKNSVDYFLSDSPIFDIFKKEKIALLLKKDYIQNSENKFLFNFLNSKLFINHFS